MNECIERKLMAMADALKTEPAYEKSRDGKFWPTHLDRLEFLSTQASLDVFNDDNMASLKEIACHRPSFVKQDTLDLIHGNRVLSQIKCD